MDDERQDLQKVLSCPSGPSSGLFGGCFHVRPDHLRWSDSDKPPQCPPARPPARLSGHAPLFAAAEGGGDADRAVGDGHPDYASSYGLFTLHTKQVRQTGNRTATATAAAAAAESVLTQDASLFGSIT
ncbi:Hypothetical predicted protein [Xyrichtys novacula]|uniref:Uncharacterized protein n=1 Tax=Xyrichtys novacula TaxID=13765 RepID=A0AAV1HNT0_XYRNO|nr:Hypothetical predicted protein [Xyrichtys novacula]